MTAATRLAGPATYIRVVAGDITLDDANDIDLIAVERAVNNEVPESLTDAELAYAARILHEHDISRAETARRLPVSADTLKKLQEEGWDPQVLDGRRDQPVCGTMAGRMQHVRRGEQICDDCALARIHTANPAGAAV
jgi:hypothetical protein